MLAAMIAVWTAVFARLVHLRHHRFGSSAFDMAIYDQETWLLSRLDGLFISVRGLDFFGHHANYGLFLLAPFYRLGAGPHFLNIVQVASLAAGAVPVYLLARDRLGRSPSAAWMGVVLAGAYLAHPALGFMSWELFHPEVMAIAPLLFAYWLGTRPTKRWGLFAACVVYAVSWKEDVALAAVMLGVVLVVRGERRAGLVTAGASLGYFVVVTQVLFPALSGEAFYNQMFSDVGGSAIGIAWTLLVHPTEIIGAFFSGEARTYIWQMGLPFGFLPVFAPLAFAPGAPQFVANIISDVDFTRVIYYHYAALPLAAMTLATVEAVAWLSRHRQNPAPVQRFLVGLVAATSLTGAALWGVSPIGSEYAAGWWPLDPNLRQEVMERAVSLPPDDASVTATYQFVPHLSRRREVYDWPNPWIVANWGVRNESGPDPDTVDWLVLDRRLIGEDRQAALLEGILDSGQFDVILDQADIVVAERVS
ncbi:MAG: DUF2079 domain-containing protein [Acidimicrobiia bacterium]